jgi:hypothetical protein
VSEGDSGAKLVRKVMSQVYSAGVDAAYKNFVALKQTASPAPETAQYLSFLEGLLVSLKEANTNHVVVEAMLREDKNWVAKCVESIQKAKTMLLIPDTEFFRLDACENALRYVMQAQESGRKPPLSGKD